LSSVEYGGTDEEDEVLTSKEGTSYNNKSMFLSKQIRKVGTLDDCDHDNPFFFKNKKSECIISGSGMIIFAWDSLIMVILSVICITMPYHIAFSTETPFWCVTYHFMNFVFFVDIILTFFTSIPAKNGFQEVFDKKKIALKYLQGWFIVDFLSILPFDVFLKLGRGGSI